MKIGILGCGVMGGAIAHNVSQYHEVILHDHKEENGARLAKDLKADFQLDLEKFIEASEAVILAIKPKDLELISKQLTPLLKHEAIVISILAGQSLQTLKHYFPLSPIFRVMPNLPLICGHGLLGIADEPEMEGRFKKKAEEILKGVGTIFWLKENLLNAFTALTSSNPAFIYLIIEAMVEAGIAMGFKGEEALEYVLQTIEGSVALLRYTRKTPAELKMEITSPGGATIAGLNKLEEQGVRAGLIAGLKACCQRADELGS
jgi:pyrroline-5-carboxylate reductase